MREYRKRLLGMLSGWIAAVILSGYCWGLFPVWQAVIFCAGIVPVSVIWYAGIRRGRAEREFYDMTGYMEQFLCSYGQEKTVLKSLENCMVLYAENSRMGKVLKDAVYQLSSGLAGGEESVVSSAFRRIQAIYPCERLKLLHTFIENISRMGGEYGASLDILQRDLQMWKQRIILHQKQRQTILREERLNIFLAVTLCWLSQMVIPYGMREIIVSSVWYQISAVITGVLLLAGAALFSWHMSGRWFAVSGKVTPKELYRQKKHYRNAVKCSAGIRYARARKRGRREIEKEFSYWVLTVTLYLQEDSVYQSIVHSLGEQNYFLRQEIKRLQERIYEKPDDIQSYLAFCNFAKIAELRTIMRLLYAANTNGVPDTKRQILFLVEQSSVIMNQKEQAALSDSLRVSEFWKQFPMIIGGIQVVFDLFLFLLSSLREIQDFV